MEIKERHPLEMFTFCPKCGCHCFKENDEKSKKCDKCGFVYYFNPSSSVGVFIINDSGELLVSRRAIDPAKGTFDIPGGFADRHESIEQAAAREVLEETGMRLTQARYIFSIPNIYHYSGFDVHTVDMFFECKVEDISVMQADDDVSELMWMSISEIIPEQFGLKSISEAVKLYIASKKA